jgi:3-isopropylmalate/(R)-2-methylmalate dehydratase small subunit
MKFKGTAHKLGEHIDTDAIIPARFLVTADAKILGAHCMEGLEPGWNTRIRPGDIIVAERNFGCGSSREHAPLAILGAGIGLVIAHSFARIFYRNSFNMGLMLLEAGDEVSKLNNGDSLEADAAPGVITNLTTGTAVRCLPLPPSMQELLQKGGLAPYVRERLSRQTY